MVCERCGYEIADTQKARICLACGTAIRSRATAASSGSYGQYIQQELERESAPPLKSSSTPRTSPVLHLYADIAAQRNTDTLHTTGTIGRHMNAAFRKPKENALLLEIFFSFLGVFGIGWLLAGEITMGVILLICSMLIYWPVMILGTLLTFGLGLLCLGPLAIAAIILNILLLNRALKQSKRRSF